MKTVLASMGRADKRSSSFAAAGSAIEEAQGTDGLVEGAPAEVGFRDQVGLISPDLLRAD